MLASAKASETDATKKNPVTARKDAETIYAIGEAIYVLISLLAIKKIFFILFGFFVSSNLHKNFFEGHWDRI